MKYRSYMAIALTAVTLAACNGRATAPTDITQTGAVLHAQTECLAETTDNPCTGWFQYWADGSTNILTTPRVTANVRTNGFVDFNQTVSGLTPDTLYHAQFCGYGDRNIAQPGLCIGPHGTGAVRPGVQPDARDYSATQNFRTASANTVATVDIGRVLSTADTTDRPIGRDGGHSIAYSSTEALWVFGDTAQRNGPAFLAYGTAAKGPYQVGVAPTGLSELPRPPAAPQPGLTSPANFFPAPTGLVTPDDPPVPCGSTGSNSYSAAWISGGARIPNTNRVLLIWAEICVAIGDGRGWPVERWRMADYDPATNRFVRFFTPFVANPMRAGLPSTLTPSNPVFGDDGYLYLFGTKRNPDAIFTARVSANPDAWGDPANYRWWGRPGGASPQWTTDHASVVSLVSGVEPWGVYVGDFSGVGGGRRLAMLVKDSFYDSPHLRIYTAGSPLGPWTAGPVGRVPDNCQGGGFGCYAFNGHPQLSTSTSFVFSWYSPGDRQPDGGHIRLGTIRW
ncbi:DUF4185 domain-containing protein [Allorhizocola rhizosphaerae]|uniref:DUF4185 domain-containing protein n=1 Tax=Allorhizocola rhizosphaerae TaxID=1872709 RepID=UPI0013C3303E|nr:DUF4185 domain-containing protein [Allorhizocola rhizosphaerae]